MKVSGKQFRKCGVRGRASAAHAVWVGLIVRRELAKMSTMPGKVVSNLSLRTRLTKSLWAVVAASSICSAGVACVAVGTQQSQADSLSNAGASSATVAPVGISCTTDYATGAKLCLGTSACPGVLVDSAQFPGCGFGTLTADFDLRCVCLGNYLCKVGTASTCQQVSSLFSGNSLASVCNQVSLGYCSQGGNTQTGRFDAGASCDVNCYSGCVGAPACIVACGC
jgi:hypothetical protein